MSITAVPIPQDMREEVLEANNFFSAVLDSVDRAEEIHHRNENSVSNNKKFPLLMQSPFMLLPLSRREHLDGKVLKMYKYTEKQMIMMENFLQRLKNA